MIKKIIRKTVVAGAVLGVVWFCWQMAVNVFLTGWLEAAVIPRAAKQAGISRARVAILKLGLFETVAGPVLLGNKERPFLEVASIKAGYTPWGLARKHINRVAVHGVVINMEYKDGAVVFHGFAPAQRDSALGPEEEKNPKAFSLPVTVDSVEITGAMVNLLTEGRLFQIPCELKLTMGGKGTEAIDAALDLFPCGQKITVTAQALLKQGAVFATLEAPALDMERFGGWSSLVPGLNLSGTASVAGRAHIGLNPADLVSASVNFTMPEGAAGYQSLAMGPAGPAAPLSITVAGDKMSGWRLDGSNLALVSPLPLAFDRISAVLRADPASGEKQGTFSMVLARSKENADASFSLSNPVDVAGTFSGRMDENGWRFDLTADGGAAADKKGCRVTIGDTVLAMPVPLLRLSGNGVTDKNWAEFSLTIPPAAVTTAAEKITVSGGTISGTADIARAPDQGLHAKGELRVALGKIRADGKQAQINKTAIHLPWQWPESQAPKGSLVIGPLTWKSLNMGLLTGAIRQKDRGLRLDARYGNGTLSGLTGTMTGTASFASGTAVDMVLSLTHRNTAPDIDLGLFAPGAAGTLVNGNLDLSADVGFHDGRPSGRLECRLDKGSLHLPEKKASVSGIQADVTMPGLPVMKSDPGQKVSFTEAAFGDIRVTDGKIDLQLESGPTLFIEKSEFQWCRGTVYTEGMRLAPGQKNYDLTLYGDRLNLADVLGQLGTVAAEGEGTVSGRIPILYSDGAITIDNGFFFSAPGEGGIIHLSKADILTGGLPVESAQYKQIDLAREALKNYQYDWAKVLLNSEGEELHIKLQFDGRPTRSLPFVYDKSQGGFVRVTDEQQYSEFKGLSLDVNFRIPLNQLIGYKEFLNMQP